MLLDRRSKRFTRCKHHYSISALWETCHLASAAIPYTLHHICLLLSSSAHGAEKSDAKKITTRRQSSFMPIHIHIYTIHVIYTWSRTILTRLPWICRLTLHTLHFCFPLVEPLFPHTLPCSFISLSTMYIYFHPL